MRTTGALQAGETVGIIGLGGLGLNGVRTAVLRGATVYGVDINPAAFAAARERGATDCFTDIGALAARKPDLVLDFAGTGSTTEGALDVVKRGGRVVVPQPLGMEQVGDHAHAALLDRGGDRVFVLVDHVLVERLGHQPVGLGIHPGRHEGGQIQPRAAVQHQLVVNEPVGLLGLHRLVGQAQGRHRRGGQPSGVSGRQRRVAGNVGHGFFLEDGTQCCAQMGQDA